MHCGAVYANMPWPELSGAVEAILGANDILSFMECTIEETEFDTAARTNVRADVPKCGSCNLVKMF
jgi:hypothetical protein